MDIVTIDFETFYDKEFSLSKMTTEEYVRSDQFETIGVGVKVGENPTDFYTGKDFHGFLNSIDYSDKAILCHNTFFDGLILTHHYDIHPAMWLDTLSMARPNHAVLAGGSLKKLARYYNLGEKGTEVVNAFGKRRADFTPAEMKAYGEYCANDVELTFALFNILRDQIPPRELVLIDRTIRMYVEPKVVIDKAVLYEHLTYEQGRKQDLLDKMGGEDAAKKIVNSNPKFASLLQKMGVTPPMKVSPTTGKDTYAFAKTDKGMQELLEHEDERVRTIAEVRLGTKSTIEETRTLRLIGAADRGALPIMLNYYGAHTGRYSGGDKLNLQNLPSRKNNAIRRAICAPEGHLLLACDAAQIEARVTAYLAKQDDLTQAFRDGEDVYSLFATDLYGYPVDKSKKEERFLGKTCILGLGYGMGHAKFKDTLESGLAGMVMKLDESEYKRIVYFYRDKYANIKSLWDECNTALNTMAIGGHGNIRGLIPFDANGFQLPNGMVLTYHGLRASEHGFEYINDARAWAKYKERVTTGASAADVPWTKIYGGKVVENLVQALARIVVFDQLIDIYPRYPVLFQVHDENVVLVPEAEAAQAQQFVEGVMSTPPAWAPDLPIACESVLAKNFGECK
jgi:DNA polymerase I-like protein with 3'-5' exonuclease and polymerase domains